MSRPDLFELRPSFSPRLWGGDGLRAFGFELPEAGPIGGAWLTGPEATVTGGDWHGMSLDQVVKRDVLGIAGRSGIHATGGRPIFPLLIKLIDARDNLSVQVHPGNAAAPAGSLGKTEAWHVLGAEPGSKLYVGLREGVELAEIAALARAGQSTAHLMRAVEAIPGATVFIPAGTLHALGAGVLIYEIQQPSDDTYRIDDWGRVDANGKPRELHVEQGLAVAVAGSRPELIVAPAIEPLTRLTSSPYFLLDRVSGPARLGPSDGPRVVTCLKGRARVTAGESDHLVAAGATVVALPGRTVQIETESGALCLVGSLPEVA